MLDSVVSLSPFLLAKTVDTFLKCIPFSDFFLFKCCRNLFKNKNILPKINEVDEVEGKVFKFLMFLMPSFPPERASLNVMTASVFFQQAIIVTYLVVFLKLSYPHLF